MKRPHSYLLNAALASGVLYFAYDLSRSGRTAIDWTVMGLVVLAILWNLFRLGQRFYRAGGGNLWHLQRTVLLWIIGLLNTALIRPEDVGSWKNVVGWVVLMIAVADSIALYRKERVAGESGRCQRVRGRREP